MAKRYQNKDWKRSMTLRLDFNNMMQDFIGEEGITKDEIADYRAQADKVIEKIETTRGTGWLGWTELPFNQREIVADINRTAKEIRKEMKYFVVLGIGGSALGPIAVFQALCHLHYNDLTLRERKGPKFYVEDNIDPERMNALLDVVEPEKTVFNVITKSGSTSETMSQYLIIYNILKEKLGDKAKDHIIATTSEKSGNLIKIAKEEGFKTYYIPDGVGGRFSELCPVGLLPAAVVGIDIGELLAGAAYMDRISMNKNMYKNPALMNAVLQDIAMKKGKNISVMMPYADSLKYFADWYCQIWAESLGKEVDNNGVTVNAGQTPVKALGVTDQHSQVQLYTEGPYDKVVTFIAIGKYRSWVTIPEGCKDIPDVNFLCGHSLNELINAERSATEYALTAKKRMNHTIYMPEVNAFTIGELICYFEMQTAFAGEFLNIDTYNQPGVENGKKATYALLGRKGFESKRIELERAPEKESAYTV